MPNRALSQVFAVIAIASSLLMGKAWALSQISAATPQKTQDKQILPHQESSCFGATVERISFPGVKEDDQQTLRSMVPVVGSSRVDLQACKLEYSIVSPK